MDEDEALRRFGLRPSDAELPEVRDILREQTRLGQDEQDTELMKLCCVQLFNAGHLEDVLGIWRAKESNWDAHFSIDVQLLCRAGLEDTKRHLAGDTSEVAADALRYLAECEDAGDFEGFSVGGLSGWWDEYYVGESAEN